MISIFCQNPLYFFLKKNPKKKVRSRKFQNLVPLFFLILLVTESVSTIWSDPFFDIVNKYENTAV